MSWITLANTISIGLIILKITPLRTHSGINCDIGHCPNNLPYCTPVGCVFQCPENTFMNGSNCVIHCGDMYIYNKTCVPTCPSAQHLVEERVEITSLQFHKYRFCVAACSPKTFQLNGTCIKSCPYDKKFVENGTCVSNCSVTSLAHRNITFGSRLLGIKCLQTCNGQYPFQRNEYCVSICDKAEVVVDSKCTQKCPKKEQNQLDLKLCVAVGKCEPNWPDQIYCSESCPETFYSYNKTCRKTCPVDASLIWNGTCTNVCPSAYPYRNLVYSWRYIGGYENKCTDKCPSKTDMLTFECVSSCKNGTKSYNDMCVKECPKNTYISENEDTNEVLCVKVCAKYVYHGKCVDLCPKFAMNNTCVDICQSNYKFVFKGSCESACPNNTCLTQDGINCTDECSFDPGDNTLAYVCSKPTPYRRKNISDHICVSNCEVNEVLDDKNNCINVTECKKAVLSHGRCQDNCPIGYLYMAHNYLIDNDQQNYFSDNTYSYNVDDLKNNPCVTIEKAYFPTVVFGLFSLLYGLWLCRFISTKQIKFLQRWKVRTKEKQAEVTKDQPATIHECSGDTFEYTEDVRLIDVANEGGLSNQDAEDQSLINVAGVGELSNLDTEDMHLIEISTKVPTANKQLSVETFDVTEYFHLADGTIGDSVMNQTCTGETAEDTSNVCLIEMATEEPAANKGLLCETFKDTETVNLTEVASEEPAAN